MENGIVSKCKHDKTKFWRVKTLDQEPDKRAYMCHICSEIWYWTLQIVREKEKRYWTT
jgi:hypothetical protein